MHRDSSARSSISSVSSDAALGTAFAGPTTIPAPSRRGPLSPQHSGSSGETHPESPQRHRRISSAPDPDSARDLWMRMLEVQQRYGCYHSARMQAAVDSGQAADLMRELSPFSHSPHSLPDVSLFPPWPKAGGTTC